MPSQAELQVFMAAEFLQKSGFKRVSNLAGGIDAWSQQVDSKVPRY